MYGGFTVCAKEEIKLGAHGYFERVFDITEIKVGCTNVPKNLF